MIVLAIDTCEVRGSVALLNDNATVQVVAAHTNTVEYSSWLLPAVDSALQSSKSALSEVDVFAVASGPGSFTGVRVGLTTVKAWSEVFNKPIVAVSRLEAVATQSERQTLYVASFIDAQRGQIFGALYKSAESGLTLIEQEMIASPEVFINWVDKRATGSDVAWISPDPNTIAEQSAWQGRLTRGEKIDCVPCILAPLIGKMAFRRALKGDVLDALAVDANYVRRSYVEVFQKGPAHVPGK
jgi:tRNA threonylcarbamoyladenosine biosynthesis protein TsaB